MKTTKSQRKNLADYQWGEINAAVTELNNDLRFRRFMDGVAGLKDVAVIDACADTAQFNPATTALHLGRVRAYQDLIDFVGERAPPDDVVPE